MNMLAQGLAIELIEQVICQNQDLQDYPNFQDLKTKAQIHLFTRSSSCLIRIIQKILILTIFKEKLIYIPNYSPQN
jgi:hypothetical protein